MPHPSEASPRPPGDYARALATPEPLLLVGGQAVNLWALYYANQTRDLSPFVSRDADVLGDRKTLETIGHLSGTKPQFFPLKPPSNEVGVVIAKDSNGHPLLIEVLRHVLGASNEELRNPVYHFELGDHHARVQVPGPIALLQTKVTNLVELKQDGRQDGRHVLILARILPAYLEELTASVRAGRMAERKLLDYLEHLLAIVISPQGRKAWQTLTIDPQHFFTGLSADNLPKLQSFLNKRLPRAIAAKQ